MSETKESKTSLSESPLWNLNFDSSTKRTTIGIDPEEVHTLAKVLKKLLEEAGVKVHITETSKTTQETNTENK